MTLSIPATSLRSKYIKTLPVGCCYKDPKSGYNYQVIEKKLNNTLVKVAVACIGSDKQVITLDDVPDEFFKLEHPQKANIMKVMKNRLMILQQQNQRLLEERNKPLYQRIKEISKEKNFFETDDMYYCLQSGMVLPMKKKQYPSVESALSKLDDSIDKIFKDSKLLCKAMAKQHSIQSNLFKLLSCQGESESKET
jgi:hypothetical protein